MGAVSSADRVFEKVLDELSVFSRLWPTQILRLLRMAEEDGRGTVRRLDAFPPREEPSSADRKCNGIREDLTF